MTSRTTMRRPVVAIGLAAALLVMPTGATAQMSSVVDEAGGTTTGWAGSAGYASANALLSGLVAGLLRTFSDDGSFGEGFRTGALGGLVAYGGKRLAARRFTGAGLLGRQLASMGGSMTSNAGHGRGALERLTFQLGLGRLYWDREEGGVSFRPDIPTLYYTTLGVARSGVTLDWSRTLSAGAPVFVTRPDQTGLDGNAAGRAFGGVILLDANASISLSEIAAHERIHVLQYDQQFALWGEAVERRLTTALGSDVADLLGRVDLSIGLVPMAPLLHYLPRAGNPFEHEAAHLTGELGIAR